MPKAIALFTVVLAVTVGCGPPQATPEEAMRAFADAFMELDEDGTLALLHGSGLEMDAAAAMMGFLGANVRFRRDFIREYGEPAWAEFQDREGAQLSSEITDQRDRIDRMKFAINGDEATATIPGEAGSMRLVRVDGKWYLHTAAVISAGDVNPTKVRQWNALAEAIEKHRDRIGDSDVEPEQLDRELGEEIGKALGL